MIERYTNKKISISKQIAPIKQANRDLKKLKEQLRKKQPIKSNNLYENYHYRQVYKKIDTNMESFFYQRQYSLQNFNFLLKLLGQQCKLKNIEEVINKMRILGIQPNQKSYNYMIRASAEVNDIEQAENYFSEATKKWLPDKYMYNSLMRAYLNTGDWIMAHNILQQMTQKGINPGLPTYTTLINIYRRSNQLQKCWQINRMILKTKMDLDQTYTGVLLKVYAATHDAEKSIKLYKEQITDKKIEPMVETLNSYLKALASRPDYAEQAIDLFFQRINDGKFINEQSVNWALKAAAVSGSIQSAVQIVKFMKIQKIQPNKSTYNYMVRVYSKVCDRPDLSEKFREVVITDTWKLLKEVIDKGLADTRFLNNVMLVYCNSLMEAQIQGLVLPLYQKLNLSYDSYTFEILMNLYYRQNDFQKAMRIWKQMQNHLSEKHNQSISKNGYEPTLRKSLDQSMRPTFYAIQLYLQIGIRTMDLKQVVSALNQFKRIKRCPKNSILKFLGELKDLPEEIQVSLMDFKIRFGKAKNTQKNLQKVEDPQNL